MRTNLSMQEAMEYCSCVGCVYPHNEQSYYVNSNIQCDHYVECADGGFYCVEINDLPKAYDFNSSTLAMLEEKKRIISNKQCEEPFDLNDCLLYFKESDF